MARTKGVNQRDVQIEIAQDADKLHPWPEQWVSASMFRRTHLLSSPNAARAWIVDTA